MRVDCRCHPARARESVGRRRWLSGAIGADQLAKQPRRALDSALEAETEQLTKLTERRDLLVRGGRPSVGAEL